jgi:hypothetical protein
LAKVEPHPTGCWIWTGHRTVDGYGMFRVNGVCIRTHRAAYQFFRGPIPDGLHVLHRCDNPPCMNPEHLRLGSNADNIADRTAKGRSVRGVRHWKSRLNPDAVRRIRARAEAGQTLSSIARLVGVHVRTVRRVVRGINWSHVK